MTTTSTSRRSSSSPTPRPSAAFAGVRVVCSVRDDGDLDPRAVPRPELDARRRSLVDLPWTMLDQRHGVDVVEVDAPGAGDGAAGDVAVTSCDDAVLGCWVADCAPVVVVGEGRVAVAHVGWRGLRAGVIDVAAHAVGRPVAALAGPTIGPCCYEFGRDDLATVATAIGASVAEIEGRTTAGAVALDMVAAVRVALAPFVTEVATIGGCTGCSHPGFSHRVRGDRGRHVLAAWRPGAVR